MVFGIERVNNSTWSRLSLVCGFNDPWHCVHALECRVWLTIHGVAHDSGVNPVNNFQVTLSFDNRGLQHKNTIYNLLSLLLYYVSVGRNSTMTSTFCLCISICTLLILDGITGMPDAVHIKIFNFKLLQTFMLNICCRYVFCMSILFSLQIYIPTD
jgi:hypothetical protein